MTPVKSERLAGKVAVVTGGAHGLGTAFAERLADEGCAVAVCDRADTGPVVEAIRGAGGRAVGAQVDVTDAAAVAAFVAMTEEALGPIDILVNNAGLFGGVPRKIFTEITSADWDQMMAVNTRGVFEVSKAVAPGMMARRAGRIINIASATVNMGAPMLLHYVASKGAVVAMTRAMARELGDFGIAVNAISPGLTMSSEAVRNDFAEGTPAPSVARRCFKREQLPADLVGPLIFLASDDSAFVTGQTYVVDGGAVMP